MGDLKVRQEATQEVREIGINESKGTSEEAGREILGTTPPVEVINIDQKAVLTTDETARYMGISKAHLYTLTMKKLIPHYKPMGKVIYFLRSEVESWLQGNRVATLSEIESKAKTYCMKGGLQCVR
ncbi:MAG: helix-turn-helix domain-containing protein [Bacteroidaceae bacterium]|nr:helix-turn-helix domain-containing protein [Bacteroidaceae bacterium]